MRDMSQSGASVGKRGKESVCHVNCNIVVGWTAEGGILEILRIEVNTCES